MYSISTTGSEKVVYSFKGFDGQFPSSGLTNVKGTLYGTTVAGGSLGYGTVYSVSTTGSEKVLHSFNGSDGANPKAGLINVGGILYGTASAGGGGKSYRGTVYSITTSGSVNVLHRFHGRSDGLTPYANLIAANGTFYGTTDQGGTPQLYGTIYGMSTTGSEKVLHRFTGGSAGSHPWAGVIDVKGALYGTTLEGGSGCSGAGCGTLFKLKP